MNLNVDGWRKHGAIAYNRLAKKLNEHIEKDGETLGIGKLGDILTVGDIFDEMNALREFVGTSLAMYDEEKEINSLDIDLTEFAPEL